MSQPLDRTCSFDSKGIQLDLEKGEFWADPFAMPRQGHNLSAYEPNRMFLNLGGKRFLDVSFASNSNIDSDSRSVMVGDFDGDRAEDLLVGSVGGGTLRLFLNRFPPEHHRVELKLTGTKSNHPAWGARVVAVIKGRKIVRDLFAANGFMGQSAARLYLGVGEAERIDSLEIRWPSGQLQEFQDLPVDCTIHIVEDRETFEVTP